MGMHLMAAITFAGVVSMIGIILKVAAGLGAVIFVHELGHFLVALACGVKVFDHPSKLRHPLERANLRIPNEWILDGGLDGIIESQLGRI